MAQRMTLEEHVLELVVDEFSRGVVIALYLVADDVYLVVYLVLGVLAVEDNIGEEVYGPCEMLALDGSIEDGILLVGKGIQVATDTLQTVKDLECGAALGALEGGMLTEMGQAFLAGSFLTGTYPQAYTAIDDRGRTGQMDDSKPIGECGCIVFGHNRVQKYEIILNS